ncbi:MAG TPA: CHAT domain-containing protein [Thermoanaerobaculia bacterium]|nr:CHAT domain-containing protein [Thermoanaerobaculia bacterium]
MDSPHDPARSLRLARRTRRARRAVAAVLALIGCCALAGCRARPAPSADGAATIASVLPGGAAEAAGLLAGDRLVEFRRAASPANPKAFAAPVRTCLDLALWEIEQAPRGPVELAVERAEPTGQAKGQPNAKPRRLDVALPADDFRLRCRPERAATPEARAWESLRRAQDLSDRHETAQAEAAFAAAERYGRGAHGGREPRRQALLALVLLRRARARNGSEDFDGALADSRGALAIEERLVPGSLAVAQAWTAVGLTQNHREDLKAADAALGRALAIQAKAAPDSLALAATRNLLGVAAMLRGDLDGALAQYRVALALNERRMPESRGVAGLLVNLGAVARGRGQLDESERYARRALALFLRIEPGGIHEPDLLVNLANIALSRGDYDRAEGLLRRALAIYRQRAPGGPAEASALSGLGIIQTHRGDPAAAEETLEQALALTARLAPGSPNEARVETNLAEAALAQGDAQGAVGRAAGYAERGLAIHRKVAPGTPILAYDLLSLAAIAERRRDPAAARARVAEAAALADRLPEGLDTASVLARSAGFEMRSGDLDAAERHVMRSLEIHERLAPGTDYHVEALAVRAEIERRRGRLRDAARTSARALDVLETTVGRLGGSDLDRTRVRAQFAALYRGAIDLALVEGRPEEAFHTLERFRARSLLDLIAERDLAPPAELPADLSAEQRRIDAALAELTGEISGANPDRDSGRLDELLAKRRRLLADREALRERIRRASPRYASLIAPVPLDLAAARRTLDPGTVWLDYAVGDKATTLFVVFPEGAARAPASGLAVLELPVAQARLADEVAVFRSLAASGDRPPQAAALRAAAARLYARLVAPAESWLEGADRLLISPDGPLAALPFAALVRQDGRGKGVYLAERWPSSTVLSATLAAELRSGREGRGGAGEPETLVAFGDPRYPSAPPRLAAAGPRGGGGASTSASRGGSPDRDERPWFRFRSGLEPLPDSRVEVRAIAELFRPARLYLGDGATEARFLADAPGARIVHFAGHALLDPRFPLDSALALSPPRRSARPGDDGLLQAWEIFERLRLRADLVTLSACATGLGPAAQGEGLLGLTRAFHYAGARTVLASLWPVSDRSTSDLMRRFYAHLSAGAPKDLALAAAQRELIRGGLAHPYHWAAFQLDGDWR